MLLKKILLTLAVVVAIGLIGGYAWLTNYNNYQSDGTIELAILDEPVRVVRDQQGIPYIYANSLEDVFRAQGFITAQDRLLQLEFARHLAMGRLAELVGPAGLDSDIQSRVMGVQRHGARQAALLGDEPRRYMQAYLDGLNAYITTRKDEHPLGFMLLDLEPLPWTMEESMALRYMLNWQSTPNLKAELLALALADEVGPERAAEISQLTVNPDGEIAVPAEADVELIARSGLNADSYMSLWLDDSLQPFELGSNQWVVAPERSSTGAAIFANNPHIDSRNLPGIWHPVGLITPEFRAVGAAGPGTIGMAVGRTGDIAFGVTNANGDGLDLYIENADPENSDHYLEQGVSTPFEIIDEVLRVKNFTTGGYDEQPLRIRLTRRGPVISDHGISMDDGRLISARWAAPEDMNPDGGLLGPLLAKSVHEAGIKIANITAPYNYVVVDKRGSIGHFTAGRVPVRRVGDGSAPLPADVGETWEGFIPPAEMPGIVNPPRGWVGNANNRTLPADYPYKYSTYFAHSWRYRRMQELLDPEEQSSPEDHWNFLFDTGNTLAQRVAPLMVSALREDPDSSDLAAILDEWNYIDDPDAIAPTVFQAIWRKFAWLVYVDELDYELAARMLAVNYYWEDRLYSMLEAGDSEWFDNINTPERETRDDLFRQAAAGAKQELGELLGPDSSQWQWGKLHTITFFSPLIPGDTAADWLGDGTTPKEGSGETLNRAKYKYGDPYRTTFIDSMRFVADMADDDKVMAVLSGGASARQFDPHLKDQLAKWRTGEPNYWWLSDRAIDEHAQSELMLVP